MVRRAGHIGLVDHLARLLAVDGGIDYSGFFSRIARLIICRTAK